MHLMRSDAMIITVHAADQYLKRVHRQKTPTKDAVRAARAYLGRASATAIKLDRKTRDGEQLWQIFDALLVVVPERDGRRVAVTCIEIGKGDKVKSRKQLNAELVALHLAAEEDQQAAGPALFQNLTHSERLEDLIGPAVSTPMASIAEADDYLRSAEARLLMLLKRQDVRPSVIRRLRGRIDLVTKWRNAQESRSVLGYRFQMSPRLPCDLEVARQWMNDARAHLWRLYESDKTPEIDREIVLVEKQLLQVRTFVEAAER